MKTRLWIVGSDSQVKIELDNEKQVARYYKRIKKEYDCETIEQNGVEVLVVICPSVSPETVYDYDVVENKKWKQDPDWGKWNDEADFWDKIKRIDNFFWRKYSYVTLVKIIPESVIPDDSDDTDAFFERSTPRNGTKIRDKVVGDLVRMAKGIQANPNMQSPPSPNTNPPATPGRQGQPTSPISNPRSNSSLSSKTKKPRKPKRSKYEDAVENYLHDLVEGVKTGVFSQEYAANLTPMDIAKVLIKRDEFKKHKKNGVWHNSQLSSIEDRVGRSKAWKTRQGILQKIYGKAHKLKESFEPGGGDEQWAVTNKRHPHNPRLLSGFNVVDGSRAEYEVPVEEFLRALQNNVALGKMTPDIYLSIVAKLTPEVVATKIKDAPAFEGRDFKEIVNGVRYSNAWKEKEEYLNVEAYQR